MFQLKNKELKMLNKMKTKIFCFFICNLLICNLQFAQNITNTLGTSGLFSIKDGTTTYLSLDQSNGYLSLNRSLTLSNTTGSNVGVIYKGADRFMHNYGSLNTFMGLYSGNFTLTGTDNSAFGNSALTSLTSGNFNSAFGSASLLLNNTGSRNSAIGYGSLAFNRGGLDNVAIGTEAMLGSLFLTNSPSNNTAVGSRSIYSIISGEQNTAVGSQSLYSLTYGNRNTSVGYQSLFSLTTGDANSAFGDHSLYSNSVGLFNTAFGRESLFYSTTGSYNIAIGYLSGYNNTTGNNNITLGYGTQVPSGTSDNQVRMGNFGVTYAGVQVAWTITSDRRWKKDILPSNLGLNFISKLNPVSYTRINDEKQRTEYGLIAQEIEEVLKEEGVDNSAMITVTDEGNYELRYNDLLAPMIKAIQELKAENDKLKGQVESFKNVEVRLAELEEIIKQNRIFKNINMVEEK
jgi:hypothetical protein